MQLKETNAMQNLQSDLVTPWVEQPSQQQSLKVAYLMSRFPKITETFILFEMLAMEKEGVQIEVYPLLKENTTVMHPEAAAFVERAHFQPFLSPAILRANLYFLRMSPGTYLRTLWTLLSKNWGSFRFFIGALGIFPKSVLFAYQMEVEGIKHIHAHFANHPAAAAFIIHRLTDISYSFTAHGSDLHRDRHMLREKVAEAAFVSAISEYNRELIVAECRGMYREKVKVIHCGVDTEVFHLRQNETSFEKSRGPFTILCVGTLHEVKGQTYLIKACQILAEKGIDFTCHFIGDGPDLPALIELANQVGLAEKIIFHGRQKQEKVAQFLQNADVLVAPSVPTKDGRREGIPVVLMEAMSCGVPVISSALSGIPELVIDEQTGLLTSPGDVVALAKALERYCLDPQLRKLLGSSGRDKVEAEFDLHRNVARLIYQIGSKE